MFFHVFFHPVLYCSSVSLNSIKICMSLSSYLSILSWVRGSRFDKLHESELVFLLLFSGTVIKLDIFKAGGASMLFWSECDWCSRELWLFSCFWGSRIFEELIWQVFSGFEENFWGLWKQNCEKLIRNGVIIDTF